MLGKEGLCRSIQGLGEGITEEENGLNESDELGLQSLLAKSYPVTLVSDLSESYFSYW